MCLLIEVSILTKEKICSFQHDVIMSVSVGLLLNVQRPRFDKILLPAVQLGKSQLQYLQYKAGRAIELEHVALASAANNCWKPPQQQSRKAPTQDPDSDYVPDLLNIDTHWHTESEAEEENVASQEQEERAGENIYSNTQLKLKTNNKLQQISSDMIAAHTQGLEPAAVSCKLST